jgi:hypothetical protein
VTAYRTLTFPERDDELLDEHRFVRSAWLSSYKHADHAGIIAAEDWAGVMHPQLTKLLRRPGVRTILAYEPPDFFYGFICGDMSGAIAIVHYVYVKDAYRSESGAGGSTARTGPRHARGLFAALGVDPMEPFLATAKTGASSRIALARKIPRARFAPNAVRYANYLAYHQEPTP